MDVEQRFLDNASEQLEKSTERQIERDRVSQEAVDTGFHNLKFTVDRDAAVRESSFVIEAIVEDLEVKRQVFAELDAIAGPETILASNSSSIVSSNSPRDSTTLNAYATCTSSTRYCR